MKTNRKYSSGICAAGGLLLALVMGVPSHAQDPNRTMGKKIEEVSKNIKALNGMPADQLIATMEFYEASLNVGCEFCHVPGGTDKDGPVKEKSRDMIRMVRALNKDNFNGQTVITCYTCHRGNPKPEMTPPPVGANFVFPNPDMPQEAGETQMPPAPPPSQIIDNYLKGLGGDAALSKISTRVVKGTLTESAARGDGQTIELVSKGDSDLSFLHTAIGDTIRVRTGEVGWEHNVFGVIRDVRGNEIDELKIKWDTLYFAKNIKQILSSMTSRQTKLNGIDAYEVKGLAFGHMPVELTFGKGTGNLIRLVYYDTNDNGHSKVQVDYSDYRNLMGTRFPYRWTVAWALGYQAIRIDSLQQNVAIDDARFVRPPNPPGLTGNGNGGR